MLELNTENTRPFISSDRLGSIKSRVESAHGAVLGKTGAGSEFLGWRDLVLNPNDALLEDIIATATRIREDADVLVCVGIGGSYLGARAVIEALTPFFPTDHGPEILFAGHHLSGAYLKQLLEYLDGKSVYLNVISKSGTTLEPAIAFRVLRHWMAERFDDAGDRIIVTTDATRGKLNELRGAHGYRKYVIPDDVGGRFSVLTPVGLLPISAAGIDVRELFYGAAEAAKQLSSRVDNPALEYAAIRYLLHEDGFTTEVLAVFEPRLSAIASWWQQLFGESEGKEGNGLFPAAVQYTTDLHSLGQYMQDGRRNVIETFLIEKNPESGLNIPAVDGPEDGLEYLVGKPVSHVNRKAFEGTAQAHADGGVPNLTISIERASAAELGSLIYFFEHAVAVGGYLLDVNPFDQPGVEAYKSAMYQLLGK
ncbi:MAG: glucose-6-phosphate isomerase [Rhodothermia bacterium]|nr:glucose-6-phosphate isomerase [Rhodothermia bacterium]